mgnify:CR=1 FL=1
MNDRFGHDFWLASLYQRNLTDLRKTFLDELHFQLSLTFTTKYLMRPVRFLCASSFSHNLSAMHRKAGATHFTFNLKIVTNL